jgi:putative toxin-antitoxin system antitoxin component (TIGR02293 family)
MTSALAPQVRKLRARRPRRVSLLESILAGAATPRVDVLEAVMQGLPAGELDAILRYGLSLGEAASALGVSARTLVRKREKQTPFEVTESDRLVRLAQLLADADRLIGDHTKALGWLRASNWGLGDRVPLTMLAADAGVELVRQSLTTIAYGGVA